MDTLKTVVCISLLLLGLLCQRVSCIDCYACVSTVQTDCGETPDGAALIVDGHVVSGCQSCVKEFTALGTVFVVVTRRCGTASETTDECSDVLGYGKCVCTTTFCNGATATPYITSMLLGFCLWLFV